MSSKKQVLTQSQENTFINLLLNMNEVEINDYIKNNGKNNSKEYDLFKFCWDKFKQDNIKSQEDQSNGKCK